MSIVAYLDFKIPFSSHRRYFSGNLQALPFYIPFQHVLPHQLTVFAGTELFQRNISPTKGLQNSTYHFWMKTRAHVGLREQSILLEAIRKDHIRRQNLITDSYICGILMFRYLNYLSYLSRL